MKTMTNDQLEGRIALLEQIRDDCEDLGDHERALQVNAYIIDCIEKLGIAVPRQHREKLTMSADEVASDLGTTPAKVRAAIENGTMPIGMVGRGDSAECVARTVIIRRRYELWLAGELRL